jgi:hypothetical protein
MTTLWIQDRTRQLNVDLLVPLKAILSKLPLTGIDAWSVRYLEAVGVMPFGVPCPEFEGLTDRLAYGVLLSPAEFATFVSDDVAIRNGEFAALSFGRRGNSFKDFVVFTLRCLDSTLWECETDDVDIVAAIRQGFKDVEVRPNRDTASG